MSTTESAIDLSMRSRSSSESELDHGMGNVPIVRPIPRPPWSIIWYQNLWPSAFGSNRTDSGTLLSNQSPTLNLHHDSAFERSDFSDDDCRLLQKDFLHHNISGLTDNATSKTLWKKRIDGTHATLPSETISQHEIEANTARELTNLTHSNFFQRYPKTVVTRRDRDETEGGKCLPTKISSIKEGRSTEDETNEEDEDEKKQIATVVDIACCDGPVRFERISNPNFALTVEHQNSASPPSVPTALTPSSSVSRCTSPTTSSGDNNRTCISFETPASSCRNLTAKTYLCIYCNQSFKSLFCYQKHKKRHLNPVSVDITGINVNTLLVCTTENKVKTKDLNVQFFPCKKCGCKFPSYYFVHKHKKTCH